MSYSERLKVNSNLYHSILTALKYTNLEQLSFSYNNERIEVINNKIKVLNQVAYSYRNFENYRDRINLHFALKRANQSTFIQLKTLTNVI